ncbi:autophagy-related protein 13-domain-containing protein [Irpex rosettiformis]|uniref:Autophagy-related protein 13-domain-containing protein n=1 Tax=Irpex rosettiformis TaxID=378272 RepID=A0ACB8TRD6_9APHY|nr:autophagy-related protein 13-domain-containing protein [Irpex rosettiformis]
MSNDTQKADQIAHRLYTKLTLVVNHARATAEPGPQAKVDKWFNIETPDADVFKEHTRIYRSISSLSTPSSFQLQVLLCVPELTATQVLAYLSPDSSRLPIDPTPRFILLESWAIEFLPSSSRGHEDRQDVAPPTMYKHSISLFRSVYTLLRILPAWRLARRARRPGGTRNGNFTIQIRVESEDESRIQDTLSFESLVQNTRLPQKTDAFPAVPHPKGSLGLSVTYLTSPDFKVFDRESLLSSRFLSQDEGPEFTPTLLKNQQRDSLASSPGSLPMRTSLPRSPPSSVADRFVIPPAIHQRTNSLTGGSPRLQTGALPMTRATSISGAGGTPGSVSGISDTSSRQAAASTGSREDLAPSALAARLRKESIGAVRSENGAGPLPIRRPVLPQVNPFKSSTLSSGSPSLHSPSPSLRQHSPLSGPGPTLPSRPPAHSSPTSSRAPALPSPIGAGATGRLPSSPVMPFKPSPPLGPSNLGGPSSLDRRSVTSTEGAPGITGESSPRLTSKRYVSSFGHRYSLSGAGSAASSSSGVTQAERGSMSFLGSHTDDDDISDFVQQIEKRKPLGSRREPSLSKAPDVPVDSQPTSSSAADDVATLERRTLSSGEPIVVSADNVDERLRQMNEAFLASLEGFGARRRERSIGREDAESSNGSTTVRAPSSGPSTLGRRTVTLDPLNFAHRREGSDDALLGRPTTGSGSGSAGYGIPPLFSRPRLLSTGSARSATSTASEEVIGRMDPEIDDGRRRSRSGGFL